MVPILRWCIDSIILSNRPTRPPEAPSRLRINAYTIPALAKGIERVNESVLFAPIYAILTRLTRLMVYLIALRRAEKFECTFFSLNLPASKVIPK